MLLKKYIVLMLCLFLAASSAQAVRHIQQGAYPHAAQCQIKHIARRNGVGAPSRVISDFTGTKNVAVIIVQFPVGDPTLISGDNSIQALAAINTRFARMSDYYNEVSYGKMQLAFTFFGPATSDASAVTAGAVTLTQPSEYYGCGDEGVGCGSVVTASSPIDPRANGDYLIRDAINGAKGANANLRHRSIGGTFDAVMVVHAGNGNETTRDRSGDIWSIYYADDSFISASGRGFDSGYTVPETEGSGITSPLGVMCHEFGHELGLPDLYNTTVLGGTSVIGDWELMDSGPFALNGENPSHMGAWVKYTLGWAEPRTVETRASEQLGYSDSSAGQTEILKLPVQNGSSQEYFLVEYRSRTTPGTQFDKGIPGDGLLIWHIDDSITSSRSILVSDPNISNTVNSGIPHYGVSIVTADGAAISSVNQGAASNVFTNGTVFINPKSDNFAGKPSGISIVNISGVGTNTASMEVVNLAVGATQTIKRAVNFPNPAGKGYPHSLAMAGGYTTLQMHTARPGQEYEFIVYTLAGDLVKKIRQDEIRLNIDRSEDEKWVYEYDWDLTNGEGRHVAPGVYYYLMRIDGESKTGKLVVIR